MPTVTADQIEDAIQHPAPGQLDLFLAFEWLVPVHDGQIWGRYDAAPYTTDYAFTRPERFEPLLAENLRGKEFAERPYPLTTPDGWNRLRPMLHQPALERCALVPTPGRALFERLALRGDYHTLHVNVACGTYDEPRWGGELRMPCGWTPLWLAGVDPRPQARTVAARSVAEIHLFMRLAHLVCECTHRLEHVDGELVAVYEGRDHRDRPVRQAFAPVAPQPDPRDFGPGVSTVLCGGTMAYGLDARRSTLEGNFHAGTRAALHERAPQIVREIDELLKMLDAATDQLPPACFHDGFAPSFVKGKQHVITGPWLRQTRQLFSDFAERDDPQAR